MILSLISLHPQLLNKGLCNDFESKEPVAFHEPQERIESPLKSPVSRTPDIDKSPVSEKSEDVDSLKQITILPSECSQPV